MSTQTTLDLAKQFIPSQFLVGVTDNQIIAFLELTMAEINMTPPMTAYTLDNMPVTWAPIVAFGASVFANLFLQANYALKDFSYSDGGLSLNVDRTAKLQTPYLNSYDMYKRQVINIKKTVAMSTHPKTLLTPYYGAVVSQYLASVFPGTMPFR